jgi:hypothetical protein
VRGRQFARTREGFAVRIKETSPGGKSVMVTPAYKSDGVWVDKLALEIIQDPHKNTVRQSIGTLFLLVLACYFGTTTGFRLVDHGLDITSSVVLAATNSVVGFALVCRGVGLGRI